MWWKICLEGEFFAVPERHVLVSACVRETDSLSPDYEVQEAAAMRQKLRLAFAAFHAELRGVGDWTSLRCTEEITDTNSTVEPCPDTGR